MTVLVPIKHRLQAYKSWDACPFDVTVGILAGWLGSSVEFEPRYGLIAVDCHIRAAATRLEGEVNRLMEQV